MKRIVKDFLYESLTYKIRGAIFVVYNILGFGHKEVIYQKALALELDKIDVQYKREPKLEVVYDNEPLGTYVPDFLVEGQVIIELKSAQVAPFNMDKQLVNYLKATGYKLALFVNFGPKLDIRRKVWSKNRRDQQ